MADVAEISFNAARSDEDVSRIGLQRAEKDMVDLGKNQEPTREKAHKRQPCRVGRCTTRATYAVKGREKCELCRKHATGRLDVVAVYALSCAEPGCTKPPVYGRPFPPTRLEFCCGHQKPGMVDLLGNTCFRAGCGKERLYGVAGSNFSEFCAQHAVDGMVRTRNPSCDRPGCKKRRRYGVPGSSREEAEFCADHADDGMVNLLADKVAQVKRCCSHPGCAQEAEYGPSYRFGTIRGKRLFCFEHAADGMLGLRGWVKGVENVEPSSSPETAVVPLSSADGQCGHPPGCTKKATHGVRGSRKRELCIQHAANTELVYLSGHWCTAPGCDRWPSFGVAGGARECCGSHRKKGMVNVSLGSARFNKTPAPRQIEIGIKRELSCEEPCARPTLGRRGADVENGSGGAPEAEDTRQREPSPPAAPFTATAVGGAVGPEQGNQAAPVETASQTDAVEPFMGLKKRRRRIDRKWAFGLEGGVQFEQPGGCDEAPAE